MDSSRIRLALALAVTAVVAAPLLVGGGVDFPDDALYYAVASWEWLRHAVRAGESPWFVPGKLGGVSLYGDVVAMGPLYPAAWLGVVLPVVPALGLATLLHVLGTVLSVRWMARVHGASTTAATLAGAAVALGPLGSAGLVDYQVDTWPAWAWLPLVIGCQERAAQERGHREERRRWLALGGMALAALLLGTHLRVAAACCGALAVWTLVRWRDPFGGVIVGLLGLVAGAPGYVPMLIEARTAVDGVLSGGAPGAVGQSIGLSAVAGWLAPGALSIDRDISLGTVLGVTALAALAGAQASDERDSRRIGLVVALLLLAGSRLPGASLVFAPLRLLSHPVDLVYPVLATIPAAILGARGLDALIDLDRDERLRWLRGGVGVALGVLAGAALLRVTLGPEIFRSDHGWLLYVASVAQAAAVGGVAIWLLTRRGGAGRPIGALFLLGLLDVAAFGVRAQLAIPSTPLVAAADRVGEGSTGLLRDGYLDVQDLASGFDSAIVERWTVASDALEGEVVVAPRAAGVEEDEIRVPELDGPRMQADLLGRRWPPHLGMAIGVRGLAGRSKLMPERQLAALRPLAEAVHDIGAVEYVLQELFGEPGALGARTMHLHGVPVAVWGDAIAFRVQDVTPLCYAPPRARVEPDRELRIQRLLSSTERVAASVALLERPLPRLPPDPRPPPAHLSCSEPGFTDVSAQGPQLVVRRERWHPGWRVRSEDGAELPTFPVNQVHLGVVVEGGTHRLSYRFVPPGLVASLAAATAGWLLLGVLVAGRQLRGEPRRGRGRRSGGAALAALVGLAVAAGAPSAARAGVVEGVVQQWSPRAEYEIWLTTSLDLPGSEPLARVPVQAGTGAFALDIAGGSGDAWLFMRQRIDPDGGPPFQLFVPLDLRPFRLEEPPARVEFTSVSPLLATLRQRGEPVPGWWLLPLMLGLVIYTFAVGARLVIRWRLQAAVGARALLGVLRGARSAGPPVEPDPLSLDRRAAPRAKRPPPPPPDRLERRAIAALLVLGAGLRLRGMFSKPLELLEHTYGPGTRRIEATLAGGYDGLEALGRSLFPPSSVEVTHPPLYHWLLSLLGLISDAEWLIRAPALLASLGTLVLLWMLLRRVSREVGLLAAGMFAFAAPAVHFGHDATPYALSALIAVASVELLLRALAEGSSRAWRRWFALFVVGFLCHYATAFFAFAEVGTVGVLALLRSRSTAWLGAAHRALGAAMLLAPLPLAWSFVHFAWFDPVAIDTRLFASVYPLDPGGLQFSSRFAAVSCGVSPDARWGALALGLLAARGLVVVHRRDRTLALVLLSMLGAFAGGVGFFWAEQVRLLDGHVFWGFRWVSWILPIVLGLGAAGALGGAARHEEAAGAGRRAGGDPTAPGARVRPGVVLARGALLATWLASAVPFAATLDRHTTRPDYEAAADYIFEHLQARDAVAALPSWGQRGPLTWYLGRGGRGRFTEIADGLMGWDLGGRPAFLEAIHEGYPFESSARNAWFERLWVAVVDERMFGQPKFSLDVTERSLRWARGAMELRDEATFDGVRLYLFARRPGDLVPAGPLAFGPPEIDRRGVPWLEPNSAGCVPDEDGRGRRWEMNVRVPLPGSVQPVARVEHGDFDRRDEPGAWTALVEGGDCAGPPPLLRLRW